MKSFLDSVAEAYFTHEGSHLLDCCFVFPNKRAATFFTDSLSNLALAADKNGAFVDPATTTIVEFVESFTPTCAADRMEMLFMLYEAYRQAVEKRHGREEAAKIDFNKFVYWGDVLLTDFDDVDNALARPQEIFKNVKDLKELSANYLTPEQLDILNEYLKDEKLNWLKGEKEFWNHMIYAGEHAAKKHSNHIDEETTGDEAEKVSSTVGFLRLWQVMLDIYTNFREQLRALGLHTGGMAFRNAAEKVKQMSGTDFPYRRYVFVGFNSLSVAESTIFKRMQAMKNADGEQLADFYWDVASPAFRDPSLKDMIQVNRYAEEFPSLYDCVVPLTEFPPLIDVYGVPSRVGQAKVIGQLLNTLHPASEAKTDAQGKPVDTLLGTAIVMPDEMLLTPLVNSLAPHITPLNLTMGYKLRNTAVAGLLRNIVSMQMRAYRSKAKGLSSFFHEDVTNILAHPMVRAVDPEAVKDMLTEIINSRLFNIPEEFFTARESYRAFSPLFTMVCNNTRSAEVFAYLRTVIEWLYTSLEHKWGVIGYTNPDADENADSDDDNHESTPADAPRRHRGVAVFSAKSEKERLDGRSKALQMAFLRRFAHAVTQLERLRDRYLDGKAVFLENSTVFNLVERIVQGEMLNFDGQPLQGLQVMGVLEARALDFDTLIIPSMNERIFPSGKFNPSFIPQLIRREYNLSTSEDQESSFTYFFYRMISRARRVFLLHDARSAGAKSNHVSRFIQQLSYVFKPEGLNRKVLPYHMRSPKKEAFTVEKTPEIIRKIEAYRTPDSGKYLSASSIKNYLACPMMFYFEKVANYRRESEMHDWMDEAMKGTVIHAVMENFFESLLRHAPNHSKGVQVQSKHIDDFCARTLRGIDSPQLESPLYREIRRCINREHLKLPDDALDTPLNGAMLVTANSMETQLRGVLHHEKSTLPFTYLHGEWEDKMVLTLTGTNGNTMQFNFNCKIDRIDRIDRSDADNFPRYRIIDYKTGTDQLDATNMESVLTEQRQKAFLQLMLYCQGYAQAKAIADQPIQPLIFSINSLIVTGILPLRWCVPAKGEEVDYKDFKIPQGTQKKWKVFDYRDYVPEFNDALIAKLSELFDPNIPFSCTDKEDSCKYCNFKAVCDKQKAK